MRKLSNSPLKEAIFELHWECPSDALGQPHDEGFDIAQGVFFEKIRQEFPIHRELMPSPLPIRVFRVPVHQYWKGNNLWPVVQHGRGMIAVNDIGLNYIWDKGFNDLIYYSIQKIAESYITPRNFNKIKLQYINAVELDSSTSSLQFVEANLQTKLNTNYQLPGEFDGFNFQQISSQPEGYKLNFTIANGVNKDNQAHSVIWTLTGEKLGAIKSEDIRPLVDTIHRVISEMFENICEKNFYASLS